MTGGGVGALLRMTGRGEALKPERAFRVEDLQPRVAERGDLAADARKRRRLHVVEVDGYAHWRPGHLPADEPRREMSGSPGDLRLRVGERDLQENRPQVARPPRRVPERVVGPRVSAEDHGTA